MAQEKARNCGFRKVGGVYLVGDGFSTHCDRLPYELTPCPTCGGGIKFARGITWLNFNEYAGAHLPDLCHCDSRCPVCHPDIHRQPMALIWIGEKFYTPDEFIKESMTLGVSRRIPVKERLPQNLHIGETWVLLAHIHVIERFDKELGKNVFVPAVFSAFKPKRVEKLIWESQATHEYLEELEAHGITPVVIKDGDKDHDPSTPLGLTEEAKTELNTKLTFDSLRDKLKGRK